VICYYNRERERERERASSLRSTRRFNYNSIFSTLSLYDPKSARARFMVDKVALGQGCLQVLQFSAVFIIPLIFMFFDTSMFAEGQMGAAWGPSIKQCYFENLEALDGIVLSLIR